MRSFQEEILFPTTRAKLVCTQKKVGTRPEILDEHIGGFHESV